MTWPTVAAGTTNLDQTTDSPATARPDLLQAVQNINAAMTHLGSAEVSVASAATTDIGNQASNRITLTGSVAITSLGTTYSGPVMVRVGAGSAPTLTYNATTLVTPTGASIVCAAGDTFMAYPKATAGTPDGWVIALYERAGGLLVTDAQLQAQTAIAFTSAGTAPAYTLTTAPAFAALAANQRIRLKVHAANAGVACTLAVNGTAATGIKQYDSAGAKVDPTLAVSQLADIEYDGTHWVVLDPLPSATVTLTGNQTIAGIKTFSSQPVLPQAATLGTAVASTSGVSIDFTSIPSWAKRVTLLMSGVSTNGTSNMQVQAGSGSVQTTGYVCATTNVSTIANNTTTAQPSTTGIQVNMPAAAQVSYAVVVFNLVSGTTWVMSAVSYTTGFNCGSGAGVVTLSGALDRIRLTTANGTDTFDAGSVNILWE